MKTQNQTNDGIEKRVSILEYQFEKVVVPSLARIESKQDAAIRQIDTLKYVNTHEFEGYKGEVEKKYATASDLRSNTKLLYWLLGLMGSIFLLGVAAFIGLVLK